MSIQNIKTLRSAIDGIISERNSIAYIQNDIENHFNREADAEIVKIFNDQINDHQDGIRYYQEIVQNHLPFHFFPSIHDLEVMADNLQEIANAEKELNNMSQSWKNGDSSCDPSDQFLTSEEIERMRNDFVNRHSFSI